MRKIIIIVLTVVCCGTSFAQNYVSIYEALTTINQFKSIRVAGEPRNHMYFIPNGVSGAPCSIMDPQNSNLYRILPNGQTYKPFNGMLDRFICNDINGGCWPVPFAFFDISELDTGLVFGHRIIYGSSTSFDCGGTGISYYSYRSTNGGANINNILVNQSIRGFETDPTDVNIVYTGISENIYKSTDKGSTFIMLGNIPNLTGPIRVYPWNNSIVFASGTGAAYRSTNGGTSFDAMSVPRFYEMAFSPTGIYGITSSGIFKSTTAGASWNQVSAMTDARVIEIDPSAPDVIYVGSDVGVYRSLNAGGTFNLQGYSFPGSNMISGLSKDSASGDTLYVCNGSNIYKVWDLQTGLTSTTSTIPSQFKLKQNYPNPFNPSTNIQFDLPEKSSISLVIYDGTGRIIAELVSSTLISGSYTYSWDAPGNPSGVYYARFNASGESGSVYSDSKKLLLIK